VALVAYFILSDAIDSTTQLSYLSRLLAGYAASMVGAVDVESKFDSVNLLMLNAGANFKPEGGKQWEDPEYFHKTFATNVFGPVNSLAAFSPLVQEATEPVSVIITGSKLGVMNPPGNPAYNASKSMIKTITEYLAHDLRLSLHV
jgi:NAD(P)-dependent dehydrogenase (short-subunit alcohol dehydrogenase family)